MPAQRYRKRGWIAQRQPLTAHRLFRGIVNATSCQTSLRFDCARAILTRRRWPAIPSISNGPPKRSTAEFSWSRPRGLVRYRVRAD